MRIDYEKIFEQIPYGWVIVKNDKPSYTILAVNQAYTEAVGKSKNELIGFGLFKLFPDINNNLDTILKSIEEAVESNSVKKPPLLRYDIEHVPKYWDLTYVPIEGNDGEIEYIFQLTQDVTDLKKLGLKI